MYDQERETTVNDPDQPVALVTGGGRGIGAAISTELARSGYRVHVNFRSSHQEATALVAELRQLGLECEEVCADVADRGAVEQMVEDIVARTGRIDVLVNNAGIARDHLVASMPEDAWRSVMDVNLGGTLNCTQAVARHLMRRRFGRIINISSVMAERGWVGQAGYAASKAAVNAFTRTCAIEFARFGITTNAVLAGMVPTDIVAGLMRKDGGLGVSRQVPLRRFGQADEVARLVRFLAEPGSEYVNGALLTVDGGISAQLGQGVPL